ncbi:hypothetical protein [Chitinophaga solisilvae]|uniref:hypothetical protein n=1 Tax=Chitinophaga solisilvae TaxID=1233460 RepID=UPI0019234DF2|nr:hypothetical protein [Chitinophaga solisilvae]
MSINKSTQLDYAIPASKIATLSFGVFVGMVADNLEQKIELKTFHGEIINDHAALKAEEESYTNFSGSDYRNDHGKRQGYKEQCSGNYWRSPGKD